ncbi:MAG: tRNA preQ1(34) S-adenosylmethionine ribosyltransferase-isomerase QueA [bacterium]
MRTSQFDYHLPAELVAQFPARRRDASRLMVLDRQSGSTTIGPFRNLLDYLKKGDALVVNSTKVFKARLFGHRASGGKVEIFLVRPLPDAGEMENKRGIAPWVGMVSPSRRVREGEQILFESYRVILQKDLGGGLWQVGFQSRSQFQRIVGRFGHVPLPHYIKRQDQPCDIRRYQTIFADPNQVGAVAAPTAGFHFTRSLLGRIRNNGVEIIETCLHVGPGTFKPVKAADIDDHVVDPEYAVLSPRAAKSLNRIRERGGSIFAVGTTSVRTLESARMINGEIQPFSSMVDLYVKPNFEFRVVDHLMTNFHLPKSSLLILVGAFAGRERILSAYREAIENRLRFYSYGDAMLIL